jgi:hypothetical protein
MNQRDYFSSVARSPLGISIVAIGATAGGLAWANAGIVPGIAVGAAALAVLHAAAALSGLGPRAAAAEVERRAWADARHRLEEAKANRNRLASLRVPDPEVKALLELAALRGSSYLSACLAAKTRDPRAEAALADCVGLADLYLKELDGAATEKRYGLPDADPFADARNRTVAALRDKVVIIERAAMDAGGGLSPSERMDIQESL